MRAGRAALPKKPGGQESVGKRSQWMEENRERLAAALESLGDGIVVTQADGAICYVNSTFEQLTGFAAKEIVGRNGSALVMHEDPAGLASHVRSTLQQSNIWIGSVALKKKDGSLIHAEVCIVPRRGDSGDSGEYVVVVRDMTARRQAEEGLQLRIRLQKAMVAISKEFAALSPQNMDKGIARALKRLGEFAGSDSAYVLLFSDNGANSRCVYEWYARGSESWNDALQQLFFQNAIWWTERLSQFDIIDIPCSAGSPDKYEIEQGLLQAQGIQSLLAVPIVRRESLIGLLGIHSAQKREVRSN